LFSGSEVLDEIEEADEDLPDEHTDGLHEGMEEFSVGGGVDDL
jgi:hypothetical protein